MTCATPQQRQEFLITETRKALAIVNRIDLAAYVQKVEGNDPMALALFGRQRHRCERATFRRNREGLGA
jgi:hypothetical protein